MLRRAEAEETRSPSRSTRSASPSSPSCCSSCRSSRPAPTRSRASSAGVVGLGMGALAARRRRRAADERRRRRPTRGDLEAAIERLTEGDRLRAAERRVAAAAPALQRVLAAALADGRLVRGPPPRAARAGRAGSRTRRAPDRDRHPPRRGDPDRDDGRGDGRLGACGGARRPGLDDRAGAPSP